MNKSDLAHASAARRFLAAALALLLASLGLIAAAAPAYSQGGGIGVAPTFIEGDDVLRGGTFTSTIILSNESNDVDTQFTLEATGDIEGWVTFTDFETRAEDYSELTVSANREVNVLLVIDVPDDVPNGQYVGAVNVQSATVEAVEANSTGVGLSAQIRVTLDVTGTEVREGSLVDAYVDPAEVGLPQRFSASVRNSGNVRIEPRIDVEIMRDGELEQFITNEGDFFIVDADTSAVSYVNWDTSEARAGDYEAMFSVYDVAGTEDVLLGTRTVPFRLEPRGTLTRSGAFTGLEVGNQPEVGSEARLEAFFENSGQIEVQAIFSGRVLVDGQELNSITSLPKVVLPNTIGRIDIVVPVDQDGEYTVEGFVNYDGFESETLSVTFVPNPEGTATGANRAGSGDDGGGSNLLPIVLIAVIGVVVVGGTGFGIARRRSGGGPEQPPTAAAESAPEPESVGSRD